MKFCAKLGHLILGVLLGICLVIGGVAAALFAGGGVGVISDYTGDAFNPPDEVKKLSVAGYVGKVIEVATTYKTSTFGQMEDAIGFNLTASLAEVIGIENDVLRNATVNTVFQDVMDGYTMTALTSKFGIELPDMPLFKDEEFLQKPVTEAFNYLSSTLDFNNMTVKDLDLKFGIKLSGDPFDSEAVQNSKISALGETVQKLALADFVTIYYAADVDMYGFEYVTVGEKTDADALKDWLKSGSYGNLFGILNGVENPVAFTSGTTAPFHYFEDKRNTETGAIVASGKDLQKQWIEDENKKTPENPVYSFVDWAKKNPDKYDLFKANPDVNSDASWCEENGIPTRWAPFCLPQIVSQEDYNKNKPVESSRVLRFLGDATIGDVNRKISEMTLGDVLEIDDNTHVILKKVKDSTLASAGADITNAIKTTQIKDLIGITTDADVAAWEAKYKTEEELSAWLNGKTAYDGENQNFDYFNTREEQQAWIAKVFEETEKQYYDEWDWKTANYGFYEEFGALTSDGAGKGNALLDEWTRAVNRKTGKENTFSELNDILSAESAEYLDGITAGAAEYAEAMADYFATEYNLYCYELAKSYCIAKPVKPEVIGEGTPQKPTAANSILLAIGGCTSETISSKMDTLYVIDVFGKTANFESGIMSLVSPYTTVQKLPDELTTVITDSQIIDLLKKGVFQINNQEWKDLSDEEKTKAENLFDCTVNEFLSKIFNNPLLSGSLG